MTQQELNLFQIWLQSGENAISNGKSASYYNSPQRRSCRRIRLQTDVIIDCITKSLLAALLPPDGIVVHRSVASRAVR
jgi:hypothetical protein